MNATPNPPSNETPGDPPGKLLRVKDVAELLGISRDSVFGLLRTGQLQSILIGKRGRRVTAEQLNAYIRSLKQEAQ